MECMLFRRRIEVDVAEARPEVDMVRDAAKELRESSRFKHVLQTVLIVGNALNGGSFRGGARGFQLDALSKLKETKTANSDPSCPTMLHYIARVLLRSDPSSVLFIEQLPHVEPSARLSVQAVIAAANTIYTGLEQVKSELEISKKMRTPDDLFVQVMEPFVKQVQGVVTALKDDAATLDTELKSVLAYYGEPIDSGESMKPEDLFGMLMTFSSALQKAAVEVHVAQPESVPALPSHPSFQVHESPQEADSSDSPGNDTLKRKPSNQSLLQPPASLSGRMSIGRGDLDAAIRSIRGGQRPRARQTRPLSKMFLDGSSPGGRPMSMARD